MKHKRIIIAVLLMVVFIFSSISLIACNNNDNESEQSNHNHNYIDDICEICEQKCNMVFALNSTTYTYNITEYKGYDKTLTIPSAYNGKAVAGINANAFRGCIIPTKIIIPDSIKSINGFAFYDCSNLVNISIPDSVKYIGAQAFDNTAWYENQPDGVVYAGKFAYNYKGTMPQNTSLTLQEGIVGIADRAFFEYTELVSITIPDGVTTINDSAFLGCTGLTSVSIPNSVTTIGPNVFYRCTALAHITFKGTKAEWKSIAHLDPWNSNISAFTVHCTDGDLNKYGYEI